jgi:hypothetical protein
VAKKFMTVSDLTGDPIQDDSDVITIIVHDHPLIEHPVQLDADQAEVSELEGSSKDFAVIELLSDGGDKRQRLVLELDEFDKLFRTNVDDVLHNAEPHGLRRSQGAVQQEEPRRRGRPRGSGSATPKADKVDYKTPENAGLIHRGRITEEEKAIVQANFDQANANRRREGQPEISLGSAKDVAKYGLEKIAQERGNEPK